MGLTTSRFTDEVRLAVSESGGRLFRNNVGVGYPKSAVVRMLRGESAYPEGLITYGLCPGSSDLIGWRPRDGVAVFTAVEIKAGRDTLSKQQRAFLAQVRAHGGIGIEGRTVEQVLHEMGY